jgi:hypothetical protein
MNILNLHDVVVSRTRSTRLEALLALLCGLLMMPAASAEEVTARDPVLLIADTPLPVFKPVNYGLAGVIPTWAVMKDAPHREAAIRLVMKNSILATMR